MGLGEWNFCLKRLSAPTKTLPLLFEAHTLALNIGQKNNGHSNSSTTFLMLLSCVLFRSYYIISFYESGLLGISVIL